MAKAALIAKQETFNSFIRFFAKNKNRIEKLAGEKIELKFIYNYFPEKDINFEQLDLSSIQSIKIVDNFKDLLLNFKVDIVIDLSQNEDLKTYLVHSLKNKKNVITSNKKMLAENFDEFKKLEAKYQAKIYYAAAFSPMPLKTLTDNLFALDEITEMNAILNATTNFILTEMEKNTISMKETLERAKESSYIEENAELDLGGLDSLYEIVLLANLFYNVNVDPELVKVKGIKGITSYDLIYAGELGYKIKLLTSIKKENKNLYIGVRPNLIRKDNFLASVNENSNAVEFISNYNSKTNFKAENTDSALTNLMTLDLIKAVKHNKNKIDFNINFDLETEVENIFDLYHNQKRSFYIRLQLEKDEEIIEEIKNIFSEKNLADLILHDNLTETPLLPVIIITKEITEKDLEIILQEVEELKGVLTVNNIIPVNAE
ncbi:homoserine dehydrogenase [Halanaerobium congolense]|jgi:homoserine dehydrogenase|uniref:Homoserine dehydrogenase n=1 Tax=Halanaerobium congolense TaxID=54121 RepID=A0A318E9V9_9FIRM|nr:homoserine dehydrogenase [Halanaerobium congolense]PXV69337.1 homoserine dehydrogenase [Halanaerobium congolense]